MEDERRLPQQQQEYKTNSQQITSDQLHLLLSMLRLNRQINLSLLSDEQEMVFQISKSSQVVSRLFFYMY